MRTDFWKRKNVFLTGHTGFKGAWAAVWLTSMGAKVTGYSLAPVSSPNLYDMLELNEYIDQSLIGDIRDFEKLRKSLLEVKPEIVFHMAAQPLVRESYQDPLGTFDVNVMGTANLLQACREVPSIKVIVVITTDKVYENPENDVGFNEENPLGGHDPYSSSKACAEIVTSAMRRSFFRGHGVQVATVRAGNVIGGGDWAKDRLVPDIVRSILEERVVQVRYPNAIRPWQHVLEPLCGYFSLAEKMYDSQDFAQAWNFGPNSDEATSVESLVSGMCKIWGNGASWELDRNMHPHESNFLRLNITKAVKNLNWRPRWGVDRTLIKTVEWYQKFHGGESARALCLAQINEYSSEL